ncbi:putative beta-1,3-galactosyltransferase 1 isoform X1 [Gossypium australe]|uniref:Hexosyltransferase n=1 Tax=Gossypium australe TaxID=47621 RepID=A0A5B6WBY4_9ROSI|nr:putative beta-1,3-galactosyltransferase 1 isoform X1 [Gossypium australe]
MYVKTRGEYASKHVLQKKLAILLCFASFFAGMFFTNRMWMVPNAKSIVKKTSRTGDEQHVDCDMKIKVLKNEDNSSRGISGSQHSIETVDKAISDLEIKLMAARAERETVMKDTIISEDLKNVELTSRRKYLMVIGINTAFSSRKRRDSVRATWMPQGEELKQLEEERGIIIRFVIGHSSTSGGILDKAIEAEERMHGDFLRLCEMVHRRICTKLLLLFVLKQQHVEGYLELSAKTKTYFATAVSLWDAEFYVKVDDDVHVNLATLGMTLAEHRKKPRVYIGCMKSGPVLARKGVKYHEPEYWKFGEVGNKYFRHATGQLYAISKDLATYILINQDLLHKYANEDVSLGSWFIGLDVVHVDDRRLCCGTPPDCEWKAQAGNICVASFDWKCSGICRSVERIMEVHERCGEGKNTLWTTNFVQTTRSSNSGKIHMREQA